MSTATIETVVQMLQTLPDQTQERAVEHLREYLADIQDEIEWDKKFDSPSNSFLDAVRNAKAEIVDGKTTPLDFE